MNLRNVKYKTEQQTILPCSNEKPKQVLANIYKTLTQPLGWEVVPYICRQEGAQEKEFAENFSPGVALPELSVTLSFAQFA